MRAILSILTLLLACFAGQGAPALSAYCDMEGNAGGTLVTSNLLFNCTHTNGSGIGTWSVFPSGQSIMTFTNSQQMALRQEISVAGTSYRAASDTSTVAVDNKPNLNRQFGRFRFTSTHTTVSCGFSYVFNSSSTFNLLDAFAMENGGAFCNLSVDDHPAPLFGFESGSGGSDCTGGTNYVVITSGKKYWITFLWDGGNARARMQVYDPVTWLIVSDSGCSINGGVAVDCESIYFGRYDAHNLGVGTVMYYDNIMIDVTGATWPLLPPGATVTAATTGWTDVSNAVYSASQIPDAVLTNMDKVSLPAGSNEWAGRLLINRQVTITGASSNYDGSVIQLNNGSDGHDNIFQVQKPWVVISNMYFRGRDAAGPVPMGWLVELNTNNCILRNCYFTHAQAGVTAGSFSLVRNCAFYDIQRMGRCFGMGPLNGNNNGFDSTKWSETFGLTNGFDSTTNFWANTNYMVFEDNDMLIDANMTGSLSQVVISSQQGQMWIARHNRLTISGIAFEWAPVFDMHGALSATDYGGFSVQAYSNIVVLSGGGTIQKLFDQRGGSAAVYSNYVNLAAGDYIHLRDGDSPGFFFDNGPPISNSWYWANFTNNGANWVFPISDQPTTNVVNLSYFTNAPPTIYQMAYPDPLWNFALGNAAGGGGGGGGGGQSSASPLGAVNRAKVYF